MTSQRRALYERLATLLALVAIGVVQWLLSRALQNDAFVDEATYIVSGQLLREAAATGMTAPPVATYLSGAPHLYPWLAAQLYAQGGLETVRAFSFACVIVAMLGVYAASRELFAKRVAGLSAAALFALQAPVLFLSRFATFDAVCVALLAVALAHALNSKPDARWISATLAGCCIGAAAVIKYATLLYVPCIVLVATLIVERPYQLRRGALTALCCGLTAAGLVAMGTPGELLQGFMTTTLARSVTSGGESAGLVLFAASLGGVAALIAVPALAMLSAPARWAAIVIGVSALLAPLNHIRLHEFVSLHKHMAFALVLFTTLAGGSMAALVRWLIGRWKAGQGVITVTVAAASVAIAMRAIVVPTIDNADRLFRYWPNNTQAAYRALAPVTDPKARFLSEEPDLGTLYLGRQAPTSQWVHPYYFDYDGARGRSPADTAPYRAAIRDGAFTAVVLRFGPQRAWATAVEEELLRSQPRYRLAARMPFDLVDGPGAYQLWVRSDAPGAELVK